MHGMIVTIICIYRCLKNDHPCRVTSLTRSSMPHFFCHLMPKNPGRDSWEPGPVSLHRSHKQSSSKRDINLMALNHVTHYFVFILSFPGPRQSHRGYTHGQMGQTPPLDGGAAAISGSAASQRASASRPPSPRTWSR